MENKDEVKVLGTSEKQEVHTGANSNIMKSTFNRQYRSRRKVTKGREEEIPQNHNGIHPMQNDEIEKIEVREVRKPKKYKIWIYALGTIVIAFFVLVIAYVIKAQTFRTKFFPNTYINGIPAEYKTPEEIQEVIREQIGSYQINIKSRENEDEIFKASDVGLHYVADNSLDEMIQNQSILHWYEYTKTVSEYEIATAAELDENKFEDAVMGLQALDVENFIAPVDAHISGYVSGEGYHIIPEVQGTTVDIEGTKEFIKESMLTLRKEINLDTPDTDFYAKPTRYANDEGLKTTLDLLNKYVATNIHYSKGITLDGNTISTWLGIAEDGNVTLDESQITEFVKTKIAPAYDTAYKAKKLRATGGGIVTIKGGSYGWKVNQGKEIGMVKQFILDGQTVNRDPEFSQKAASLGENDYGNSYVEVNLAAQKAYLYKEGNLVVSTDFVSGNIARGWGTPGGAYSLSYKQRNATLNGEGYSTPVDYWMPFNRGIGFHDASWRGAFGGAIYKTNGSHGCINLPPAVAKVFFNNISAGYPVLCHFGGGVPETAPATPVPAETTAAPTTAVETVAPGQSESPSKATETLPSTTVPNTTVPNTTTPPTTVAPTTVAVPTTATPTPAPETTSVVQPVPTASDEGVEMIGPAGN